MPDIRSSITVKRRFGKNDLRGSALFHRREMQQEASDPGRTLHVSGLRLEEVRSISVLGLFPRGSVFGLGRT